VGEEPERRKFLKSVGLATVVVAIPLPGMPLGSGGSSASSDEKVELTDEDKAAWRERRKSLTRGFVPECHDEFP
jgi:hypothetical protein